jgi:hypothetical protein
MAKKADLQKQATELGIELKHEDGKDLTIPELESAIAEKEKEEETDSSDESTKDSQESTETKEESKETKEESKEEEKPSGYPKYERPAKTIQAARILCVKRKGNDFSLEIEGDYADVSVTSEYIKKYNPKSKGYYVTCEKGCQKYLSETEFEEYNAIEKEK